MSSYSEMQYPGCTCSPWRTRTAYREFFGRQLACSDGVHHFLRFHVDVLNNGGGNGEPNAVAERNWSDELATYGQFTFSPLHDPTSILISMGIFDPNGPIQFTPVPSNGPGAYVYERIGLPTQAPPLISFVPGDEYTVAMKFRFPLGSGRPDAELNYYWTEEFTVARMGAILEADLADTGTAREYPGPSPYASGGWRDQEYQSPTYGDPQIDPISGLPVRPVIRVELGEQLRTPFGVVHGPDQASRFYFDEAAHAERSIWPGALPGDGGPHGLLRRAVIRVPGQHKLETIAVDAPGEFIQNPTFNTGAHGNLTPGQYPTLACENIEIGCNSTYTIDPPAANDRRILWLQGESCAP